MSLTLNSQAAARSVAPWRGVAWMVEMLFTSGTQRFTNAPVDIPAFGQNFIGLANLVGVSPVTESENTTTERMTFSFSVVNQAMLALTLGSVDTYRGRKIKLYLQFLTEDFKPDGDPVPRWFGYMDKVQVSRRSADAGGGTNSGTIEMIASRAGMARARNYEGLRLTHAQHIIRFPGDNGLEYVQRLVEQPSRWLSRRFQELK